MTKGERSALAAVPTAVYRFYDSENNLLYVGMTHDLDERWATHERIQPWWLDVVRREFTWYDTRAAAEEVETTAAAVEKPRYHRIGNRTASGEVDQRMATEIERAMQAVSVDIGNGTYPLWRFLPAYPVLSKKYGISVVGVTRGLARLAYEARSLVYDQDQFAVSRPDCVPSRDAKKVGLLYFLASNAFGDSSFTLTDLVETTGVSRGTTYQHVKRWQEAGRVECLGHVPGGRALVYRIFRHPEPDPPRVLTSWRHSDVLAIAQWLNDQMDPDAIDQNREIIAACLPNEYGVSNCGVRVLKVLARRYKDRPGCLPEWGITEGAEA